MKSASPQTILCVPGLWKTRSDLVTSIAEHSGGYLFAGVILMHIETQDHFTLEVCGHDERLRYAFAVAGRARFTPSELADIDKHTFCLYLVGEGGSVGSAGKFMKAGKALLDAGGLGVKVESAGTAHAPAVWRELCSNGSVVAMLKAFVAYVGEDGQFYSCGMHNLGYPDCAVEAEIETPEAVNLLHTFLLYLLTEKPQIKTGQTFSVDAESPRYRFSKRRMLAVSDGRPVPQSVRNLEDGAYLVIRSDLPASPKRTR
jgi:Domain of unknown function (DUF4261)